VKVDVGGSGRITRLWCCGEVKWIKGERKIVGKRKRQGRQTWALREKSLSNRRDTDTIREI